VSEVEQRLSQKQVLRLENQDVSSLRPDESHFSKLDSSLKKNTAFVRKLVSTTLSCAVIISNNSCVSYLVHYVFLVFNSALKFCINCCFV
jgi:regulator of nonsense transcripts 2